MFQSHSFQWIYYLFAKSWNYALFDKYLGCLIEKLKQLLMNKEQSKTFEFFKESCQGLRRIPRFYEMKKDTDSWIC